MSTFIVFEGIDGSGTTSTSKRVADKLRRYGLSARWTCEPTAGPIGKMIRAQIKEQKEGADLDPAALALLFAADRVEHEREISKWVLNGDVVICDRYLMSSVAYQGTSVPRDWILEINAEVVRPDLTIYLACTPLQAMNRLSERKGKDIFENMDFLRGVHDRYEDAYVTWSELHRIHRLDSGAMAQDEVVAKSCAIIMESIAP